MINMIIQQDKITIVGDAHKDAPMLPSHMKFINLKNK